MGCMFHLLKEKESQRYGETLSFETLRLMFQTQQDTSDSQMTAMIRNVKAAIIYSVSGRKYFSNLRRSWLEFTLLLVFFIFPSVLNPSSQMTQASTEVAWFCRSTLRPGTGPLPGLEGAPMRVRPLSKVGESRHRSATNLRSTVLGFPSVSLEENKCRVAHLTALKAHTPSSPAQLEHRSRTSAAHSAEHSSTSTSRMPSPHTTTLFIPLC